MRIGIDDQDTLLRRHLPGTAERTLAGENTILLRTRSHLLHSVAGRDIRQVGPAVAGPRAVGGDATCRKLPHYPCATRLLERNLSGPPQSDIDRTGGSD